MARVYMYHPVDILFPCKYDEEHLGGRETGPTLLSVKSYDPEAWPIEWRQTYAPRCDGPIVVETLFAFLRYSPVLEFAFVR